MDYIATFYSHFGALRFKRQSPEGVSKVRLMPVPRNLSSSCGTSVRFEGPEDFEFHHDPHHEIEQIVRVMAQGYESIYRSDES